LRDYVPIVKASLYALRMWKRRACRQQLATVASGGDENAPPKPARSLARVDLGTRHAVANVIREGAMAQAHHCFLVEQLLDWCVDTAAVFVEGGLMRCPTRL
jgi:hypothetical protein